MTGTLGLLTLAQWLSPSFPLGSFAYSHGLEAAMTAGEVRDAASLAAWVGDVVEHGSGYTDAALLAAALEPGADHSELAATARALATSRERLAETEAQGAAFTATVNALTRAADPPAPLPVVLGRAAAALDTAPGVVVAFYLQAFAANLVLAGVRFLPLGQTEGQAVLSAMAPLFIRVAGRALDEGLAGLGSATLGADLAAMRHETLDVRIFRT